MRISLSKHKLETVSYMALLLVFSGNPVLSVGTQFGRLAFSVVTLFLVLKNIQFFFQRSSSYLYFYISFFLLVFFFQNLNLGFISYPAMIGFILKILLLYVVVRRLADKFFSAYFNAIYIISVISLIGFTINIFGYNIPDIFAVNDKLRSVLVFTQNGDGSRNSGMFWEPGAFACYINLAFLFYLGSFKKIMATSPNKVAIIVIALLTTFSTTGYLVFFAFLILTVLIEYSRSLGILVAPILIAVIVLGYFFYEKSPFLKEKIDDQLFHAEQLEGDFSNSRFGSFYFDLHYINKHPWFGNGLHQSTRYADHPWLQNERLGHGNGFSNFLASMGIISFVFFAFLLIRYNVDHPWLFLVCVVALLQGEQLMNYPLWIALPLVFIYGKKYSRIVDLP